MSRARRQATLELSFAGALWGFGFVAAVWALRGMGPFSLTGWRFALAVTVGFAICLCTAQMRSEINWQTAKLAFVPGCLLATLLLFQTCGLKYTTASRSAFLTTLYVLIVPILERIWFKKRISRLHWWAIAFAFIGVTLICDLPGQIFSPGQAGRLPFNFGDALTLVCALAASFHILWFGLIQERIGNAFVFNCFQSLWAAIPALALAIVLEPLPRPRLADFSLIGLLSLAFGSTLIAFAFQVRAQKILSPGFASLLFLLESPFATFFGVLLLGERLNGGQSLGAALIFLAAGLSTTLPQYEYNKNS